MLRLKSVASMARHTQATLIGSNWNWTWMLRCLCNEKRPADKHFVIGLRDSLCGDCMFL